MKNKPHVNIPKIDNLKPLVKRILIEEMENAYKLAVPLKADCGKGKNWLEAH